MKNKHHKLALIALISLGTHASGAWTPIESFEGSTDHWSATSLKIIRGDITQLWGSFETVPDPLDPENTVGAFSAGPQSDENVDNPTVFSVPLPQEVPAASTAVTWYSRVFAPNFNFDVVWGLSPLMENVAFWNDDELQVRITQTEMFDVRDGGNYAQVEFVDPSVWYEFWFVVNNLENTYEVYAKGGAWTEQTRLESLAGADTFVFRVGREDSLKRMTVRAGTGSAVDPRGRDPLLFDDFFIDYTGVNLSTPEPSAGFGEWAGYPILDAVGTVDTGDWLGLINVANRPWIYVPTLGQWAYIDETVQTEEGGWLYVVKP